MPVLDNARWERYCQYVCAGCSKTDAYANAGYVRNFQNTTQLDTRPIVQARIKEIKEERAQKLMERDMQGVLSKNEAAQILSDMARNSGDMYKRLAIATLARLYGWNEPDVVKVRKETDLSDEELEQFIRESKEMDHKDLVEISDREAINVSTNDLLDRNCKDIIQQSEPNETNKLSAPDDANNQVQDSSLGQKDSENLKEIIEEEAKDLFE